jgi:hypothetical protein
MKMDDEFDSGKRPKRKNNLLKSKLRKYFGLAHHARQSCFAAFQVLEILMTGQVPGDSTLRGAVGAAAPVYVAAWAAVEAVST